MFGGFSSGPSNRLVVYAHEKVIGYKKNIAFCILSIWCLALSLLIFDCVFFWCHVGTFNRCNKLWNVWCKGKQILIIIKSFLFLLFISLSLLSQIINMEFHRKMVTKSVQLVLHFAEIWWPTNDGFIRCEFSTLMICNQWMIIYLYAFHNECDVSELY